MSTILHFPNVHGLRAPLVQLPADAAEALAVNARTCRFDLAEIEAARMACASSEPMPLPEEPWHLPHMDRHTWPWGHSAPLPLTQAELDARISESRSMHLWHASSHPLPAIFGPAGPVMYRPHPAPTWRERLRAAWVDLRIRLGLPL